MWADDVRMPDMAASTAGNPEQLDVIFASRTLVVPLLWGRYSIFNLNVLYL